MVLQVHKKNNANSEASLRSASERLSETNLCRIVQLNFGEFVFRDCMKRPQTRVNRLVMRRIMAAYTNASPLAQSLS